MTCKNNMDLSGRSGNVYLVGGANGELTYISRETLEKIMIKTLSKIGIIGLIFHSAFAGAQTAPSTDAAFDGLKITLCGTSSPCQRLVAHRLA